MCRRWNWNQKKSYPVCLLLRYIGLQYDHDQHSKTKRSDVRENSPKISERPHIKMLYGEVLFLFGLCPIFSWSSSSSGCRCVAPWRFIGSERSKMADIVTVYFLFVLSRARCAGPSVSPGWFRDERRLDTMHVEKKFASVALYSFWTT